MGSLFRGSQRSVAFYTDSYRYINKELALRLDGDVIFETQGVLSLDPASKMMGTTTSASDVDKTAVLDQLERILGSTVFRNSKRHSSLLRHLVERSVAGTVADLKERTLGVEVFGRPADYDNYADPVVRISAGEVRKRIAQYYHEPDRERELRIELPLGSYVPEFHKPAFAPEQTPAKPEPESVPNKPSSVLSRRTIPDCGIRRRAGDRPSVMAIPDSFRCSSTVLAALPERRLSRNHLPGGYERPIARRKFSGRPSVDRLARFSHIDESGALATGFRTTS
jgi:hypothetical protein